MQRPWGGRNHKRDGEFENCLKACGKPGRNGNTGGWNGGEVTESAGFGDGGLDRASERSLSTRVSGGKRGLEADGADMSAQEFYQSIRGIGQ